MTALVQDTLFVRANGCRRGAPVVNLLPPGNVKVRFFVPETQVGALKPGQPVELALRRLRRADPRATITYIAPQAEYTPPVIYSREQPREARLPGRGAAAAAADAPKLHPGQPVDVTLR